ncbi:MAG: DegV family protein [Anaerolineae bacterium]|jgi:fatty acid-binding protein DegV
MIRIVTDSTCDLPLDLLRRYDIPVVPINIQFGTETYEEAVSVDRIRFYSRIDGLEMIPTTLTSIGRRVRLCLSGRSVKTGELPR